MIFTELRLKGAYVIDPERLEDERGFFARIFCYDQFQAHNLNPNVIQSSISFNERKGTLRGLHYQAEPYSETKLVRCTMGAVFDVIVDLRPASCTFLQWVNVELTSNSSRMIYIPKGFAHGFQTLKDNTEVVYQMSEFYRPEYFHGVRWNDPVFAIEWPDAQNRIISEKDQRYADINVEMLCQDKVLKIRT